MQRMRSAAPQTGQARGSPCVHGGTRVPPVASRADPDALGADCRREDAALGAHVLVVEDEADLRSALVELLSLWGYRVSTASDGREALERLSVGREPVLMLLDLQMPVMDGDALLD